MNDGDDDDDDDGGGGGGLLVRVGVQKRQLKKELKRETVKF